MGKTALQWYQRLPEPIRTKAINNWVYKRLDEYSDEDTFESLHEAIGSIDWDRTEEGWHYWVDLHIDAQDGNFPNLHGWIAVSDRLPDAGSEVLVIGDCDSDLSGLPEKNQVGIVVWDSVQNSKCKDWCYYSQWYTNIQFWQPLPKLPEVKGGENA